MTHSITCNNKPVRTGTCLCGKVILNMCETIFINTTCQKIIIMYISLLIFKGLSHTCITMKRLIYAYKVIKVKDRDSAIN